MPRCLCSGTGRRTRQCNQSSQTVRGAALGPGGRQRPGRPCTQTSKYQLECTIRFTICRHNRTSRLPVHQHSNDSAIKIQYSHYSLNAASPRYSPHPPHPQSFKQVAEDWRDPVSQHCCCQVTTSHLMVPGPSTGLAIKPDSRSKCLVRACHSMFSLSSSGLLIKAISFCPIHLTEHNHRFTTSKTEQQCD